MEQGINMDISRRALVAGGSAVGLVSLSLVACSDQSDTEEDRITQPSTPDPDRPKEAPMLAERVQAGTLPPLEDRLPAESDQLVVEAAEFGTYGGDFEGTTLQSAAWIIRMTGFEPMLRPSPDLAEEGLPGILKEVETNEDGTEYTLHLRESLKWSDGEPCTSADVIFAIENVYFNEELYATPPQILTVDGEPCTAEPLDDYTVVLTFPHPKGDFIDHASRQTDHSGNFFYFPKHYMEQFHPDLNEQAEESANEAGYGDWVSHWTSQQNFYDNPDKPVLFPWVITNPLNSGTVCSMERNPYYWSVDSDGAQLPYIDRMNFEIIEDDEVMLLKAVNGELDFHARNFNSDQNRPVLADAQDEAGFRFITVETTSMNQMCISLNQNHKDSELRNIFQNKDFRIGLSHAINRQEIIDTTLQRQGEPWQAAPHKNSVFYNEEFAKQYTDYDLDIASEYLDSAGLTERDSAGYRLRSDGERLRFNIDVQNTRTFFAPAMDIIVSSWAEIGIDAQVNMIEMTLFADRRTATANDHDAQLWVGDGGLHTETIESAYYFPTNDQSAYAPLWTNWFMTRGDGDVAEEPPAGPRRQMELYWEMLQEPNPEARHELFREIIDISKDEFYCIGVALPSDGYGIAKNHLRNVLDSHPDSWAYRSPGHINIPTWFFDQSS